MAKYSLNGRLGNVIARGGNLRQDVAEAVLDANLSLSTTEVTQLTLTVLDDANLTLLRSGLFQAGTPRKAGSRCDYGGLHLEVRAVEVAAKGTDHVLTITARSFGVGRLRRQRGTRVRKAISPTQYARAAAKSAGLKFIGQPTAKRKNITRKKGESEWAVLDRLAGEVGFLLFEAGGTLVFGKPTWLVDRLDPFPVAWNGTKTLDTIDELPTCRRSGDDEKRLRSTSLKLRGPAAENLTPVKAVALSGIPTFNGRYLIETVTINLAEGAPIEVAASTPVNPEKQPPEKPAKKGSSTKPASTSSTPSSTSTTPSTGATGRGTAAAFVALCLQQAGDRYVFGAEASASDPNPNTFDCSELIEWASARVGVPFVDGSINQIGRATPISLDQGIRTRGAILWHPGHVAVSLGNGKTIEAANSRVGVVSYSAYGRFQRAGLIPGMRY